MSSKAISWAVVAILVVPFVYWQYTNYAHNSMVNANLGNHHDRDAQVAAVSELIDKKQLGDVLPTTSPTVHFWIADALQTIAKDTSHKDRSTEALNQLVSLMKDPSEDTRGKAQRELVELGATAIPGVIPALGDGDAHARKGAVSVLVRIGQASIPALVKAIQTQAPQRSAAIDALVGLAPAPTPEMLKLLQDKDKDVRSAAATYFGNTAMIPGMKQTQSEDLLLGLLKDKDVRPAAMRAEGLLGDPRALGEITKALIAPQDADNRRTAIVALGDMRAVATAPQIIPFLEDQDPDIQSVAAVALHSMDAGAIPALTQGFANGSALTRKGVAESLQGETSGSAIHLLTTALHDTDPGVRQSAAESLGARDSSAAVAPLIAALTDPSPDVAEAAETSLSLIGAPAIQPLVGTFSSAEAAIPGRPMAEVVAPYYASKALVLIGSDAAPAIIAAAQSGSVAARTWALVTLADLRPAAAKPVLEQIAASGAPALRWFASDALRHYQV